MQLTVRQAARCLGVTESALERWVEQGELPATRVDDQYRLNRVDLLEWAAERHLAVSPEILEEPGARPERMPRFSDCVRAGGIHRGVPGSDKQSLLRAVADLIPVPLGTDRTFLFQMLLAREKLGSTAIGNGIAIPHPRDPIVLRVQAPSVTICMLEEPAEFEAFDGKPVHTLLVLVTPSVRMHLHVLSVTASVLHDPRIPPRLAARDSPEAILAEIEGVEAALARARAEALDGSDAE